MNADAAFRTIGLAALLATVLLSLPLVGGFFGRLHPAFDSMAHFRVHLAALLMLAALPLLLVQLVSLARADGLRFRRRRRS